jgi:hypothetical protein
MTVVVFCGSLGGTVILQYLSMCLKLLYLYNSTSVLNDSNML